MSGVLSTAHAPTAAILEPRPPVIGREAHYEHSEALQRQAVYKQLTRAAMELPSYNTHVPEMVRSSAETVHGLRDGAGDGTLSPIVPLTAGSTPPVLRWATGLNALLDDKEGVEHFQNFLREEGCPEMLKFWFACQGLKQHSSYRAALPAASLDPDDASEGSTQLRRLIVAMFRRFIRNHRRGAAASVRAELLPLSNAVRQEVADRVEKGRLDVRMFDPAQAEVEDQMRRTLYPNFLQSDYYIQLLQAAAGSEEAGSALEASSSCASSCYDPVASTSGGTAPPAAPPPVAAPSLSHHHHQLPGPGVTSMGPPPPPSSHLFGSCSGGLSVVPEEAATSCASSSSVAPLTRDALLQTQQCRSSCPTSTEAAAGGGSSTGGGGGTNPYHTLYSSYNPVSRQDSELQSMSSEATTLTDDTSRAGSSVDGRRVASGGWMSQKRLARRQHRLMKESARANHESSTHHTVFIPRNSQGPAPPSVNPTVDVPGFARLLSSKLEQVIIDRELAERNLDSKRLLQDAIGKLGKLNDQNDQEILDAHISKVFESSHQTPQQQRSGAHSPSSVGPPPSSLHQRRTASHLHHLHHHHHHATALQLMPPPGPPSLGRQAASSTFSADSGCFTAGRQLPKSRTFPAEIGGASFAAAGGIDVAACASGLPNAAASTAVDSNRRWQRQNRCSRASSSALLDPDSGVSMVSLDVSASRLQAQAPPSAAQQKPLDKVLDWIQSAEPQDCYPTAGSVNSCSSTQLLAGAAAGGVLRRPPAPQPPPRFLSTAAAAGPTATGPDSTSSRSQYQPTGQRTGSLDRQACDEYRRIRVSEGQTHAEAAFNSLKRHPKHPRPSQGRVSADSEETLCIAYTFCGEQVPYMTRIMGKHITLRQFKQLLPRKGNYRYFFKTACADFETGVIQEEVVDDSIALPLWEGKVHGQVMTRD